MSVQIKLPAAQLFCEEEDEGALRQAPIFDGKMWMALSAVPVMQ